MKFRVNPMMIPMVAVIYFSGNTRLYIMAYVIMALHEAAHLVAALCIGLKPQSFTFSPFGVNLKLKNKIISSVTDEVILYGAGPLVNAVLALVALAVRDATLYRLNTALLIMNLMPVIPLDGGMICMRLLSFYLNRRTAKRMLNTITGIFSACFLITAVFSWYKGYINISMFIVSALLIGNLLTSAELCDVDFINILSGRKKRTSKIKCLVHEQSDSLQKTIQSFSPSLNNLVFVKDQDGKISEILTEEEIVQRIGIYEM